jgi:eukaryotic-like serine/threonine-protein kinase
MFRHDAERTGHSTSTAPDTNETLWTYDTTFEVDSSPAIANSHVIVGVSNGDILALDLKTGELVWKHALESGQNSIWSSPAIDSGRIYIGDRDSNLNCLNETNGNPIWNFPAGSSINSSPVVNEGKVYFYSEDGYLYCLSAVDGAFIWKSPIGDMSSLYNEGFPSPAISSDMLYVGSIGSNAPTFHAINATTGETKWIYPVGTTCTPAISDGKIFFSAGDSNVYCLNESTGLLVWNAPLNFPGSHSSPAISDGRLFIASGIGKLYCLNSLTGLEIWNFYMRGQMDSSPCVADGKVLIGSSVGNGFFYCLNESTGNLLWNHSTIERIVSSPAVSDGIVVVGCGGTLAGGGVFAFGTPIIVKEEPNYLPLIVTAAVVIVIVVAVVLGVWKLRKKYTLKLTLTKRG